jgi:hypothetical protein
MNNTGRKFGGRKKGVPNKITSEIRDKIQVLISGTMDSIDISTFTKMEKIKLLQVLCQYIIPKLQSADFQIGSPDRPSAVHIKFMDNNGNDISDQKKKDIEHLEKLREVDENDYGLAVDMHNIIYGDEEKIIEVESE